MNESVGCTPINFYHIYRRAKETRQMETSGKVNDVEESLKKLGGMKGAVGGFVMTLEGEVIKSTLDLSTSSQVNPLLLLSACWQMPRATHG